MIVYNNLNGKTAEEILYENEEQLYTDAYLLEYEPERSTSILLGNLFGIPSIIVQRDGEEIRTAYPKTEEINRKFYELSVEMFGKAERRPYSEWLAKLRRESDEERTRRELKKFISSCRHRLLSPEFKQEIKAVLMAI